jgi:hypothetical protein
MLKKFLLLLVTVYQALTCHCQTDDRWYILCLDDKPAGYYHEKSESQPGHSNAGTRSESSFKMSMSRLGSQVDMQNTEIQKEDSNGRLINILNTLLPEAKRQDQIIIPAGIMDNCEHLCRIYHNRSTC